MSRWAPWEPAACDLCGADLEVCTDAPAGAYDGDPIRCTLGHTGRVTADEGGAWVTMYDQTAAEIAARAAWVTYQDAALYQEARSALYQEARTALAVADAALDAADDAARAARKRGVE